MTWSEEEDAATWVVKPPSDPAMPWRPGIVGLS